MTTFQRTDRDPLLKDEEEFLESLFKRSKKPNRYEGKQVDSLIKFYNDFIIEEKLPKEDSAEFQELVEKSGLSVKQIKVFCWNRRNRELMKKRGLISKIQRVLFEKAVLQEKPCIPDVKQELPNVEKYISSISNDHLLLLTSKENIEAVLEVITPNSYRKPKKFRWSSHLHRIFLKALSTLKRKRMDTPEKVFNLIKTFGEGNNLVAEEIKTLTKDNVAFHLQKYRKKLRSIAKKDGICQNPISSGNGEYSPEMEIKAWKLNNQSIPLQKGVSQNYPTIDNTCYIGSSNTDVLPYNSICSSDLIRSAQCLYPFPQQQYTNQSEFSQSVYPQYFCLPYTPANYQFGYGQAMSSPSLHMPSFYPGFHTQYDFDPLYEYYSAKQCCPIQQERAIVYIDR